MFTFESDLERHVSLLNNEICIGCYYETYRYYKKGSYYNKGIKVRQKCHFKMSHVLKT